MWMCDTVETGVYNLLKMSLNALINLLILPWNRAIYYTNLTANAENDWEPTCEYATMRLCEYANIRIFQ